MARPRELPSVSHPGRFQTLNRRIDRSGIARLFDLLFGREVGGWVSARVCVLVYMCASTDAALGVVCDHEQAWHWCHTSTATAHPANAPVKLHARTMERACGSAFCCTRLRVVCDVWCISSVCVRVCSARVGQGA